MLGIGRDIGWFTMFPENRSHRRHRCRIQFLGASSSVVTGEVQDLSPTGMCLLTETTLAPGRELHFHFELASGVVEVVGEVRRVVDAEGGLNKIGIRFSRIPIESLAAIKAVTMHKEFVWHSSPRAA